MTEYSGAVPPGRRQAEAGSEIEDGGPVGDGADVQLGDERVRSARPRPEPQSSFFVVIMGAVGLLGIVATTTGLVFAATTTSEPFWHWTTAIYFVSLALGIWALGVAASQVIQRRQFIGIARAAGRSFMEDTQLQGGVSMDELERVQRLRSQLYAIGAHRAGEDLSRRLAMVIEDQQQVVHSQVAEPYRITEEP